MAGLTKTERNRNMKVEERDRIRKQFVGQGLPVPPLMDPDVLGRGPGEGPSPVGANEGDEETKPSAATVARQTRKAIEQRTAPVPASTRVDTDGETKEPPKKVQQAVVERKIAGRDINLRGEYDEKEQEKAVALGKQGVEQNITREGVKPGTPENNKSSRAEDVENPKPKKGDGTTTPASRAEDAESGKTS